MPRNSQTTIPPIAPSTVGIVALAGGGRAGSPVLTGAFNVIATCATGADSVTLPAALAGLELYVQNDGAASAQVFGNGTDTINGTAGATGVAQANGKSAIYFCAADGKWNRVLSA